MKDERRRAPRVPVSVYLQQHIEGQSHRCFMSDLSLTGLYMERPISSFIRHSTRVQLEIPLPDGEADPVWASAEIIYDCFDSEFHGTAVRFDELGERDRRRLTAFLAGRPPEPRAGQDAAAA
jgi:PilZ domain